MKALILQGIGILAISGVIFFIIAQFYKMFVDDVARRVVGYLNAQTTRARKQAQVTKRAA